MENCVTPIIVSRRSRFRIDFRFIDNLLFLKFGAKVKEDKEQGESVVVGGRKWRGMALKKKNNFSLLK